MAAARPWTVVAGGVVVVVRLTPKGGRDAVETIEKLADGKYVLKARVHAAASEGEANGALMRLIADVLDIAPRDVSLVAGAASRIKRLMIAGDSSVLSATLERQVLERKVQGGDR